MGGAIRHQGGQQVGCLPASVGGWHRGAKLMEHRAHMPLLQIKSYVPSSFSYSLSMLTVLAMNKIFMSLEDLSLRYPAQMIITQV
jgi:hypothetical protein